MQSARKVQNFQPMADPPQIFDLIGVPGEIRTHGPQIRNLVLYPAELRGHQVCH